MSKENNVHFFNTFEGKVEPFQPRESGKVAIYTCGPTVYDYAHMGNFRAFVFEDLLIRFLLASGFKVKHVMNVTDVDDKTIAGANCEIPEGEPRKKLRTFTQKYLDAFHEDLLKLNIFLPLRQNPDYEFIEPRATEEIDAIRTLIHDLTKKEYTYSTQQSIYYQVSKFGRYGRLSKKKLEANIAGARVDADEYDKEAGADFALWKKAKPGEPSWPAEWGEGRPGWHIECSAMSMKYLGPQFDIHCGGEDLIFPHHENEIAQSEAATGKQPFVKYWLHCKHLLVDGEKMSKSKGNFYTLRDLLAKGHDPMAVRYALISVHYRQPLNFTMEGVKEAEETLRKLDDCYYRCLSRKKLGFSFPDWVGKESARADELGMDESKIMYWLGHDDLNISAALSHLHEAVTSINEMMSHEKVGVPFIDAALGFFRKVDFLLGLDIAKDKDIPQDIINSVRERQEMRSHSDFKKDRALQKRSDDLRDFIQQQGWLVKDGKPGEPSTVTRKREGLG